MDITILLTMPRKARIICITGFVVPFVMILTLFVGLNLHNLGIGRTVSLTAMSASLSVTYLSVTASAMKEKNLLTSELGQLAMSSAMLSEMVAWCLLATVLMRNQVSIFHGSIARIVIWTVLYFSIYVARPVILQIINKTPKGKPVDEKYVMAILIGVLLTAPLSDIAGGIVVPGVLLLGLIIPDGQPLGAIIVEKSELMVMEFFLPLFYVQISYFTDVSSVTNMRRLMKALLIILTSYLAKFSGTLLSSLYFKVRLRNAILLSLILNFKCGLDIMIYQRWLTAKFVDEQTSTTLVLCHTLVTASLSPIVDIFYKPQIRLEDQLSMNWRMRTIQATHLNEELRILCCVHKEDNVHSIINLLETSNPSKASPICAYVIHLIELAGHTTPILLPCKKRIFTQFSNTDHIVRAFMNYSKDSRGPVIIQPFMMIAPYDSMDKFFCNFVQERNIPLIIIPFYAIRQSHHQPQTNILQNFNDCTVGILVDRGTYYKTNTCNIFYNVVVLFVGCPDDREALVLAIRMSGNLNVSITLLQINLEMGKEDIDEMETLYDELLVTEFKKRNANKSQVICNEVVVNDSLKLMDILRTLNKCFDLVVEGRRQTKAEQLEEEMLEWMEFPELGLIGDILASFDFNKCTMPVLVMQQCKVGDGSANRNSSIKIWQ